MDAALSNFIATMPDAALAIEALDASYNTALATISSQQDQLSQLKGSLSKSVPTVFDRLERIPWLNCYRNTRQHKYLWQHCYINTNHPNRDKLCQQDYHPEWPLC